MEVLDARGPARTTGADGGPGRLLAGGRRLRAPTAERTALALHPAVTAKVHPAWPVQGLPDVSTATTAPTSPAAGSRRCGDPGEHLRLDPATGVSVWLRDHADHLVVLMDPDGPFRVRR